MTAADKALLVRHRAAIELVAGGALTCWEALQLVLWPTPALEAAQRTSMWPRDYPERARQLHADGLSCPRVAERLGVPFATAKTWIWPDGQKRRQAKCREANAARSAAAVSTRDV